jgi:hypothetical protein
MVGAPSIKNAELGDGDYAVADLYVKLRLLSGLAG